MQPRAYLSAEIGWSAEIPTYSGGLGVLAGDHMKAAADAGIPLVGVTLLYREGYFRQHLDAHGKQSASYPTFEPDQWFEPLPTPVAIQLEGRRVELRVWRAQVTGATGKVVPILLLDSDVADNHAEDRPITHRLYGGDERTRLRQECVLGFGGLAALRTYHPHIERFHLNEGHCAFLTLALLKEGKSREQIRAACHFTTHTPVPAGHDSFFWDLANEVMGDLLPPHAGELAGHDKLDMSTLSLNLCGTANGVSALHGEVSRKMFPGRDVGHVTNGVHHHTWVGTAMAQLFDSHLAGWRTEPQLLGRAATLPDEALRAAHAAQKRQLLAYVNAETNKGFRDDVLTLGFARRAATYKRAGLLFSDPQRLVRICGRRVQILFAGKAHPRDHEGQDVVAAVHKAAEQLGGKLRVAYLPNYNMWSGALITAGVDVWLNNPVRPREASGTSGMKATLNGVPNASIADGWWAEAVRDGQNGWLIGQPHDDADDERDADALYRVLENQVIPTFYERRHVWATICKEAIATGAQYTADRMVREYISTYYGS